MRGKEPPAGAVLQLPMLGSSVLLTGNLTRAVLSTGKERSGQTALCACPEGETTQLATLLQCAVTNKRALQKYRLPFGLHMFPKVNLLPKV